MISRDMRYYDYFTFGEENAYGQPTLSIEPKGKIKMAINLTTQSVQDTIKYKEASYIGLTFADVDDSYVIKYGEERLKVLYVTPKGRYKQVYMRNI